MILLDRRQEMPLIFRPAFKLTMMALCTVLTIIVLLWVPALLSSFLLALIFVFILGPAVDFFERRGISRAVSILIVFSVILGILVLLGVLLSRMVLSQYGDLASRIDFYSSMVNDEINRRLVELERRFGLARFEMAPRVLALMKET
ncbi:MAG TPA: AI-2E family transporter, partial [Aggregatilineales bacterium]|nr:AI-2E family transporter [Aggregatilineales bacterium]